MTELKLVDISGLLPNWKEIKYSDGMEVVADKEGYNECLDELSTKNLLDFVEAVVCDECRGKGLSHRSLTDLCELCHGTGAVIRVKEWK